jgi:hypothetical protein
MRDTITMNSLPTEILERIIKSTSEDGNYWGESWRKYYLRECALVSRRWAVIANSLLWKEVSLYSYRNKKEFSFYRHITTPGYVCGKYIRKLIIGEPKLWPICIGKILSACPGIVELKIKSYRPYKYKGEINLLRHITKVLPNLQKLNLNYSESYFKADEIQQLIESKKIPYIKATRDCVICKHSFERYDSSKAKKWICLRSNCPNYKL